jgi:adenine-specific DNA-methyltransferase
MEKQELINKIKSLDGLNNDEKSALLELLKTSKKYGLVWEDKPENVEEKLRNELPVLKEVKERAIISDNPDAPNHILIEGDNLHALTALTYTHKGKIDVIYIDPPYNTGNKDFIYNDSFIDKEDEYRHSKWITFIRKRLKIGHRLLSDNGVIFASVDDNEVAQLKLICDEIFLESNFIGLLPRVTKKSGKAHSDNIAKNHDYVLIYTKNKEKAFFNGLIGGSKGFDNTDEFIKLRGKYKLNQTLDYDSLWYNPAMDFPLNINGKLYYPGGDYESYIDRHNGHHNAKDWVWRWSEAKFNFGYYNGFVVIKKGKKRDRIYTKTYLNASISKDSNGYYIEYTERDTKMSSLALVSNEFSNDNAKKEIADIIGGNSFDFPKPITLIKILEEISSNNNGIILDFFAGSGTTLHATLQLNNEDGGHRQCIIVTNNENNICEEVTYMRNKKVIEGYTTPKGEQIEGLTNNNLRYYKTEFVPREQSPHNMHELVNASTELLCIKEDLYIEAKFNGKEFNPKVARYFSKGNKQMLIVYREESISEIINELKGMSVPKPIKIYVFSTGRYAYNDEFSEVKEKVELCALPAAILDAYRKVLPWKKDEIIKSEEEITDDTEPQDYSQGSLFTEEGGNENA